MKEKISFKELLILIVGMFIIALGVYYIMIPSNLVIGTISGVVVVLTHFIPLSVSTLTLILNIGLLILGFIFIGNEFGGKTVITSILLPLYMRIFEIISPNVQELTDDLFLNVICFVLVLSLGQAMLFNINASSGGLDIVAKLLNKYLHVELGKGVMISGFAVAATSLLVSDKKIFIVSLVGTYLGGIVLDYFIDGSRIRKKVTIISPNYSEIQKFIIQNLNRGVTLYPTYGGWNHKERMELVTILQPNEYAKLLEFVHKKDPKAFVTVSTVGQVIGQWNPHIRKVKN